MKIPVRINVFFFYPLVFLLEHGMVVVILFDDFKEELAVLGVVEAKVEGNFVFA